MTPFSPTTISWSLAVDLKLQRLWVYVWISHPSSHVWMLELDHKESWVPKNWCFWTVMLEKTLESPLDCKEIKPVNPKGNQPWIFIEGLMLKLKLQYFGHLMKKNGLIRKDSDAGQDGKQKKGTTEDEMVGWHHRLNGHIWANSRSWWWTGKPGKLQSMESQRVGHNQGTELNWTALWSLYSNKQTRCEPANLTIAILSAIYFKLLILCGI